MKRILITGANSYIGTSVEKYLAQWPEKYHVDTIDMIDDSWREHSFTDYDSVFHVAGIAHINTKKLNSSARERYWAVNALLPVEVAQKAKAANVRQFIFLSSMSVYGEEGGLKLPVVITKTTPVNPRDIYGASKAKAEEGLISLQSQSFHLSILRPPMVYGPGCKGNYQRLARFAKKTWLFPNLDNRRSILFIGNLLPFIRDLIDDEVSGKFYPQNLKTVSTYEIVSTIAMLNGKKIRSIKLLNPLIKVIDLSIIRKVFGSLFYDNKISHQCDTYDFLESIKKTEGFSD
jgi:nucleoside-diphosphate-sugar epimerase